MLIFVQLDISGAETELFEAYEAKALALLAGHGGTLVERLRSIDSNREYHLLRFADAEAFDAFRSDPRRADFEDLRDSCRVSSTFVEVHRVSQG